MPRVMKVNANDIIESKIADLIYLKEKQLKKLEHEAHLNLDEHNRMRQEITDSHNSAVNKL